jgi:undecaprenyl pyrophosphate phosphatase UppP
MLSKKEHKKEFSLLDSAVINLIIEKTKLNKEKYSLILSKTVIVYVIIIALTMYSAIENFISNEILAVALVVGTLLLFVVYLYVIEHFNKMDRDIDEVVSLLQTKAIVSDKKKSE